MRAPFAGLLGLAIFAGATLSARAVTVDFDHATQQGANLGTLVLGQNRVSGFNSGVCVPDIAISRCDSLPTWDAEFILEPPTRGHITAVSMTAQNFEFEGVGGVGLRYEVSVLSIYQEFPFYLGDGFVSLSIFDTPKGPIHVHIGPDNYKSFGTYSNQWEFQVWVAPIPLPATLPLICAALVALGAARRRRRGPTPAP